MRRREVESGPSGMPSIAEADLARMRRQLLFDGPERGRKLSRYWALLLLASVIATAGVVADSTATVIGAMIVAPLMTPILGTVLSIVCADLRNLGRSLLLTFAGAVAVVGVAWAFGYLVAVPIDADTSSQVAGRVHPRLADLVAALATGAVGSFALVRSDVSDTLPGVAIAISLVPPLAVVGLTLESGESGEATGALLLFLTNVTAILLSGFVVMGLYRVRSAAGRGPGSRRIESRLAVLVVVAAVVVLSVPLAAVSRQITADELNRDDVESVARNWAVAYGWEVVQVETSEAGVLVRAIGPLPIPDARSLRTALDAERLQAVDVRLELSPAARVDLPGG